MDIGGTIATETLVSALYYCMILWSELPAKQFCGWELKWPTTIKKHYNPNTKTAAPAPAPEAAKLLRFSVN